MAVSIGEIFNNLLPIIIIIIFGLFVWAGFVRKNIGEIVSDILDYIKGNKNEKTMELKTNGVGGQNWETA